MKLKSRTALMLSGALAAAIRPKLAQDAKVDISDALDGVTASTITQDGMPRTIAGKIVALVTPHLAQDQALTEDDVVATVETVEPSADDTIPDDKPAQAPAPKPGDPPKPVTEPTAPPANPASVAALDEATVQRRIDQAVKAASDRADAIRAAEREVKPFVGEIAAMDSAEAIYKLALDAAKVDLTGVEPAAYRGMVRMLAKPDAKPPVTVDHKSAAGMFDKIAPNRAPLVLS